ncbi:MAG: V-type H(+)-translocating pyrophosphatase [Chlamydiia bacterium]|nr:V-type H(+)-translocating pyrophosphatase [Chlamydiia bacterium]
MVIYLIYASAALALVIAAYCARSVSAIPVKGDNEQQTARFREISSAIAEGAMAFLAREFRYVGAFAVLFAVFMYFSLDVADTEVNEGLYSAIAFLLGAGISTLSAFLGMRIATTGNVRTTIKARSSLGEAFDVAFKSGGVMGFGLVGLAILGLMALVQVYGGLLHEPLLVMEQVASFGLGASSVALFSRVGGGIFTKAADVGADLVGKVEQGIPEDDPRNPATIADNVGDNVGDVAGMGADLFGSCAEATCAALVIGATSAAITGSLSAMLYPILISAVGVPVCAITAYFARLNDDAKSAEPTLKMQLVLSTVLMTIALYFVTNWAMVPSFELAGKTVTSTGVLVSVLSGLWSGLLIGYVTEYCTSHAYRPVRQVAMVSANGGAATNIIYGLALGYQSAVVPVLAIATTVYVSWSLAGMYGIAVAALGMISTIAVGLTIDAYGPVSDNAGGIAEMVELEEQVRKRTDLLDAAGNTTAAIGKGFAIGSAVLTALALFSAFLTRVDLHSLNLLTPLVFSGLLVGGVLPFLFTAQTLRGVGLAANTMIEEVRRQFRERPGILTGAERPDYAACVDISTTAAIREMVAPGMLVMLTPLVFGFLFGTEALAGLLAGSLVSGLVKAIAASNAGGAWDNAKKYIESGEHGGKGSDAHGAAVIGDTVGDPFKDTSGPSINILMKLMAILSLVFAPFFVQYGGFLLRWINL